MEGMLYSHRVGREHGWKGWRTATGDGSHAI
jgi:hypothetical protein